MADEQNKMIPINYTNRDFASIRDDLMQIAERLYPDSFQDFSEGSFGSMMLDAVAYVGDQLSFYLDYNVNETFLDTAYQTNNIIRHGRILGYKNTGAASTYGQAAFFVLVPASSAGLGPASMYYPVLKRGSTFSADNGNKYVLTENIDFSDPSLPMVVARVNNVTGAPTYYAIKAYGSVVSGQFSVQQVAIGPFERFKKVTLRGQNIAEIISIVDSEGNEYFEVDYLSQDMIFRELPNNNYMNDNVPSILKPVLVSRKFTTSHGRNQLTIQFGSGDATESDVIADPSSVAADLFGKKYISDLTFDPTRLSKNISYGIVPQNTTLTIIYRANNASSSNVATAGLNKVVNPIMAFRNEQKLASSEITSIRASLEVINETPIIGKTTSASPSDLKRRIYDTYPSQNRAVTQSDYESLVYRMPAKYGSIKRCSMQRDPDSLKRNLNLYVISDDKFGKLTKTNQTIKNNLKNWLDNYRMMNDTIDILDPYVINIGINFIVRPSIGVDKFELLAAATAKLQERYVGGFFIGESVNISEMYSILSSVTGVLDVISIKLSVKQGSDYGGAYLDVERNLSPDGGALTTPLNAIVQVKFPEVDIRGTVR